ncbi:MAG: VOC family protein [Haloarculaceae archaeon]
MDVAHVALCVSDLDRALEFYGAIGLEEHNRFELNGVTNVYVGDEHGELQLRYDPDRTTPIAPNRADMDHVGLEVEDVEGTYEDALDAGASTVLEPQTVEAADAYVAFVEDPEGYTVEFFEWV